MVPVAPSACQMCDGDRIGLPFKPGEPPKSGKRTIAEVQAELESRPAKGRRVRSLPVGVCMACGVRFKPGTHRVAAAGGGFRHVSGSPACERGHGHAEAALVPVVKSEPETRSTRPHEALAASEEPCACPTCGRPVVDGAPYDLHAIRQALQDAIKAVDDLISGADSEREALEELDEPA